MQQSPWLSISNKQLELMGRFMVELGLKPSARTRLGDAIQETVDPVIVIRRTIIEPSPAQKAAGRTIELKSDVSRL